MVLMAAVLVVIFSSALIGVWRLNKYMIQHDLDIVVAAHAAHAGAARSAFELSQSVDWTAGYTSQSLSSSSGTYSVSFTAGNGLGIPHSTNNTADVNLANPSASTAPSVAGYNGRTVPPNCVDLIAIGSKGTTRVGEELSLWVLPAFEHALAVTPTAGGAPRGTIQFQAGGMVDSWNSNQGSYALTRIASGGDLLTNYNANNRIVIRNATVNGNITVAPGGGASAIQLQGSGTYTGSLIVPSATTGFYNVTAPSASAAAFFSQPQPNPPPNVNRNGGVFDISPGVYGTFTARNGAIVNFSPGSYVFTQFNQAGTGAAPTLNFNSQGGPVFVYITSSANIRGYTIINQSGIPGRVLFIATSAVTSFILRSINPPYMAIWAPAADVSIPSGVSDFYGAIVGRSVSLQSATNVHFDQALRTSAVLLINQQRLTY